MPGTVRRLEVFVTTYSQLTSVTGNVSQFRAVATLVTALIPPHRPAHMSAAAQPTFVHGASRVWVIESARGSCNRRQPASAAESDSDEAEDVLPGHSLSCSLSCSRARIAGWAMLLQPSLRCTCGSTGSPNHNNTAGLLQRDIRICARGPSASPKN